MCDSLIPIRSFVGRCGSTGKTERTPQRGCRIRAGPASAADLESRTQAGAQPARWGSDHHWFVHPVHAPVPHLAFCHCCEIFYSAVFPQPAEETQVPHVGLTAARSSAWTKGTGERTHRRRCRNETAESSVGLSPNCPADRLGFR